MLTLYTCSGLAAALGCASAEREAFAKAITAWRRRRRLPAWCEGPAREACAEMIEAPSSGVPALPLAPALRLERKKAPRQLSYEAFTEVGETLAVVAAEPAEAEVLNQYHAARAEKERRDRERFKALDPDERRTEGPRQAQQRRHAPRKRVHAAWRKRAGELWAASPGLSINKVAATIKGTGIDGLSTIKTYIRDLKPVR